MVGIHVQKPLLKVPNHSDSGPNGFVFELVPPLLVVSKETQKDTKDKPLWGVQLFK